MSNLTIRRQAGPHCYINARGRWTRNWEWVVTDKNGTCVGVFYKKSEAVRFVEESA